MLKHVAVCCSVLQCVAVSHVAAIRHGSKACLQCVAVCCSVMQCVAVCCSVLQYFFVYCSKYGVTMV